MEEPPGFGDGLEGGRGQGRRESIEISRATAVGEGAGLSGEAMVARGSPLRVVIGHQHVERARPQDPA